MIEYLKLSCYIFLVLLHNHSNMNFISKSKKNISLLVSKHKYKQLCPRCKHDLRRVRRSIADKTFSTSTIFYRYKCRNHACRWEGLLPSQQIKGKSPSALVILFGVSLLLVSWQMVLLATRCQGQFCDSSTSNSFSENTVVGADWYKFNLNCKQSSTSRLNRLSGTRGHLCSISK